MQQHIWQQAGFMVREIIAGYCTGFSAAFQASIADPGRYAGRLAIISWKPQTRDWTRWQSHRHHSLL